MTDDLFHMLHDPDRLAALHRLGLLDTAAEPAFDRLTRLAATIVQTPVALVVLLDANRQFFKSAVGVPEPWASRREMPVSHAFWQHALRSAEPLIVEDARQHPTFLRNLVVRELGVMAYLGIPLRTSAGHPIGAFCVIDSQPRPWTLHEIDLLQQLAAMAMAAIEARYERIERQRVEAALQATNEMLWKLIDASPLAIIVLDLMGKVQLWNPAAARLFGWTAGEVLGQPDPSVPKDGVEAFAVVRERSLRGEAFTAMEVCRQRRDGSPIDVSLSLAPLRDAHGTISSLIAVLADITAHKQAEAVLQQQALYDGLTGLPNRVLVLDRLRHALAHAQRHPAYRFAVLFLDLDRFKTINDSLGHRVGDQLLMEIAHRLQAILRPEDTIARLGGDEFVLLLEDLRQASDAIHVATRIQHTLAAPFHFAGSEVVTSASIGIALSRPGYTEPEELLRDADLAMYRAKAQGKAGYAIFDQAMHTHATALLALEAELRRAIEHQELELHYQPIVALATGQMTGVEALVRWQHPTRGLLAPAQFIPLAEESGLIVPLGAWVVRSACMQAQAWHVAGLPLTVAVNFSARQFRHPEVRRLLAASLAETGLAPQALHLELTESSVMEDAEAASPLLADVHALGIQLVLDDFGTGYSCLSYLKRLPITTVKIDRSFVRDIPSDPQDAAITSAIIALAHNLNLLVTAEGVETEAQLDFLRAQAADAIQGYLCSRPLPAATLTPLLQQGGCFTLAAAHGADR